MTVPFEKLVHTLPPEKKNPVDTHGCKCFYYKILDFFKVMTIPLFQRMTCFSVISNLTSYPEDLDSDIFQSIPK
jgi:hypothetical protein